QLANICYLHENARTRRDIAKTSGEDIGSIRQLLEETGGFSSRYSMVVSQTGLCFLLNVSGDDAVANATNEADDADAIVERKSVSDLLDSFVTCRVGEGLLESGSRRGCKDCRMRLDVNLGKIMPHWWGPGVTTRDMSHCWYRTNGTIEIGVFIV